MKRHVNATLEHLNFPKKWSKLGRREQKGSDKYSLCIRLNNWLYGCKVKRTLMPPLVVLFGN
jgi:hypothetical protein